jgi:hypothetical protein
MNLAPILGLALLASPQEAPLDLHVEGAPLAGRPLELVVTGPAERAVMLRVQYKRRLAPTYFLWRIR